ncbi:MAG: ATP-binding protein [candidate division Zixibacteria bacterium]|nr:ATP-binding protein [candidate division Zixibacteria bacterium]
MPPTAFKRALTLKTTLLFALILAVLFAGLAFFGIQKSKKDLLALMSQQAEGLLETLSLASTNALKANRLLESMVESRLSDLGYFVADLWENHGLAADALSQIAHEAQLDYINLLSPAGKLLLTNSRDRENDFYSPAFDSNLTAFLKSGDRDRTFSYRLPQDFLAGERMAALVRTPKGMVNLVADQTFMRNFQTEVGIGYLIQKIAASPGVVYIVLQSSDGIILASRDVSQMTKIQGAPFLENALSSPHLATRLTDFEGNRVFEAVHSFSAPEFPPSLFRVGLSLEGFQSISASFRYQIIFFSALLFLLGLVAYGYFASAESVKTLESRFSRLKGTTDRILEDMEAAVVVVDAKGQIRVANRQAEKLLGVTENDTARYDEVFKKDELGLTDVLQNRRPKSGWQFTKEERFFLGSSSPLFGPEGVLEGGVAVISDWTRLKKLEEEAKKSERLALLGNLAAGVAHEIRNPLNTISIAAQRLKNEFSVTSDQAEFEKFVTAVENEARRINQSVSEFLGLVRSEKLQKSQTNWSGFWNELVTAAQLEGNPRKIKVEADPAVDVEVEMDAAQLKKALFNLVRNACEATPEGGKLTLKNRNIPSENRLEIIVQDTGPGIPQETLPKIFDPYFTTKSSGTGLGLAIAHRIVSEHNGRIDVGSEPGKGTTCTINLPLSG